MSLPLKIWIKVIKTEKNHRQFATHQILLILKSTSFNFKATNWLCGKSLHKEKRRGRHFSYKRLKIKSGKHRYKPYKYEYIVWS